MIYTDLAIESASMLNAAPDPSSSGITVHEASPSPDVKITRITIDTEEAASAMHKPCGTYITIESPDFLQERPEITQALREAVAAELTRLVPFHPCRKVLIAGIGNEKITPDSLGPHTISKIRVTRHLFVEYEAESDTRQTNVAAIHPGVMAQTGIETAEILHRLVDFLKPDVLIAVDSLAARDVSRMNTTIQITDTGIAPGAGTKNHRVHLTKETMGCQVIAIGVPTVIHCQALLNDPEAPDLIVTGTNIDQVIHDFSSVIADGLDLTLHPGLFSGCDSGHRYHL
ncbi:MAG: GPR endopeptidase [Firmicutes bacterium]|nr:GPR endopeptidase [Bacillota bacterium]